MTKILVLAGGDSDEREVSLRSGGAVHAALQTAGYDSELLDYNADQVADAQLMRADVVFPALHGIGGEDGQVQSRLEKLGLPFVGSDSASSALCMDKRRYKQHVRGTIPVPEGELVDLGSVWQSPLTARPFVLKPSDGGSSVDTFLVRDTENMDRQGIEAAFARHPQLLLEELISGIEITVAVLGDQALPAVEIIPPAGGEFDYANKYNGATQELCPPANVAEELQRTAGEYALEAHRLCGCRDMSRTDMIITADNQMYILETNTIPGLTSQSLLPKEAAAAGITMPELAGQLVEAALARR